MTARVVYSFNVSVDGYINSPTGSLDWADVDEEVHSWFNDQARQSAALVYGRRLYDDVVSALPALKREFDGDLDVGGAALAAPLIERNLVDEYRLVVHPVALGGGTPFFPPGVRVDLRTVDSKRFANGAVLLVYERR